MVPTAPDQSGRRPEAYSHTGDPTLAWSNAQAVESHAPPRELGEYRLLGTLGRGNMGVVYRAVHRKLKRPVAIKVLPADRMADSRAVMRFLREMEAVGRLDHPNIVRAYDAGEVDGTYYLAMEYVDGTDVSHLVSEGRRLGVADACAIISQAATGLQHAHENGLVHRDIKPSNLLVSAQGVVKVADLGLARVWQVLTAGSSVTGSDVIFGTVDYMAPEQADAAHDVDARADVYSLGCTLYRLITGRVPYDGPPYDSVWKKVTAHRTTPFPPLSVPDSDAGDLANVDRVLRRMTAKPSGERFGSAREVGEALSALGENSNLAEIVAPFAQSLSEAEAQALAGYSTPAERTTIKGSKQSRRGIYWGLAIGLVVVAAITSGVLSMLPDDSASQMAPLNSQPGAPDKLPAKALSERWRQITGGSPTFIEIPSDQKPNGSWRFDDKSQALLITSSSPVLLKLGTLSPDNYVIGVDLSQPDWHGEVGIFLNYYEAPVIEKQTAHFQLIYLQQWPDEENDGRVFKVRRMPAMAISRPEVRGVLPHLGVAYSEKIPWLASGETGRLELHIGRDGVRKIMWNGRALSTLTNAEAQRTFKAETAFGDWGIYQHSGTTFVRDPQLTEIKAE